MHVCVMLEKVKERARATCRGVSVFLQVRLAAGVATWEELLVTDVRRLALASLCG